MTKTKQSNIDPELADVFGEGDLHEQNKIANRSSTSDLRSRRNRDLKGHRSRYGDEDSRNVRMPKYVLWFYLIGGLSLVVGVVLLVLSLTKTVENGRSIDYPAFSDASDEAVYSDLTGEKLASSELKSAPAFCVQTPNGMDGARPQAGLSQAGVIFEAVAEAGITRFAAIYQNPTSAIIGPIRSLRTYYLEWDTPFDCTIVHAGGSGDALAAVSHGYRDLTEDYNYMYRGTYGGRLWNNLFTTSTELKKFNQDHGYSESKINGFARMTPTESAHARVSELAEHKLVITEPSVGDTSALKSTVDKIGLRFGGWANFNVNYTYDAANNRYLRSYESGAAHEVYQCPEDDLGERNPEDACTLTQMAPSVVIAIKVKEHIASDNYHEDITTTGSGEAYVFQNGTAIQGTWNKPTVADQISFKDKSGNEIKLAPGQTIVSAVPEYGSVDF